MKNDNSNEKMHVPYASRLDMVLYAALGIFNIAIVAIAIKFVPSIDPVFWAIAATVIYLFEVAFLAYRRVNKSNSAPERSIHGLLGEDGSVLLKNTKLPIIAFDLHGTVLWYNDAMRAALDSLNNYIGDNITEVLNIDQIGRAHV